MDRQVSAERNEQDLWDKFWKDKDGKVVIFQWPNLPLIAWAVLSIISMFVPTGILQSIFWWLSEAVLTFWAVLEIWKGVNYFRRTLGAIVLLLVIASVFGVGR